MCLLKEVCAELCASGRHSDVGEVVSHWSLDQTLDGTGCGFDLLDANMMSLVLSLRVAYEECEKKPTSWPSCVRKDILKDNVSVVARNVGQVLASCPVTDVVPPVLEDFCRWWLKPHKGRDPIALQEQIWPALEEGLFPEGQAAPSMAQALRGLADLARCLSQSESEQAAALLVGLFQKLGKAWEQLFWCVASKHSPAHQAATFAHSILVELVGGVRPPEVQSKKANKKRKRSEATKSLPMAKPMSLDDDSRLLILSTLQEKKAFQRVPQNLKKQWQQALLSPLSPKGVRARCGTIISGLVQGNGPPMRVVAAQLEQLAVHSKVPDEAVLAVVFQQFLASFIAPSGSSTVVFSLRAFQSAVALPGMLKDLEDVALPVQVLEEEERLAWRQKLWSTTAQLTKRTWPEAAEKLITGEDFSAAEVFSGGEEGPGSMVRSLAYQGCLSDGSLLVFRLLQWWNHVVTKNPEKAAASTKKKKTEALCTCLVEFEEADTSMHQSSLELCQTIMDLEEGKSGLSARQKNAVCSLPLSLSLVMLDESAPANAREVLGELLKILEHVVEVAQGPKPKKKIAEALAAFAPVAAELYVADSLAMIREACKMTWRELAFYAADETLTGLCSSVCGKAAANEDEPEVEEDEDMEDDEDEDDDPDGKEKAVFDKAIAAMKERNQAAAQAGDEDDEDDVTTLDHSGVLSELLDDGGGALMNSFAASSLEGATNEPSKKKKLTKRQQKLRLQQDELVRRLREADLVESFLMRPWSI